MTLVTLEIVMIFGNELLIYGAVILAGLSLGVVIRAWWMIPVAPIAFFVLINVHTLIFGWFVYVEPVDQHLAGMVYFFVTLFLIGAVLASVTVGTLIGKLFPIDGTGTFHLTGRGRILKHEDSGLEGERDFG
jgi:hypothetical protein